MIYFFVIFSSLVASKITDATGVDFYDQFDKGGLDKTLWVQDTNMTCESKEVVEKAQCVLMKKENFHYFYSFGIINFMRKYHTVELTLRNNCDGLECCNSNGCTKYTSAQLVY